MPKFEQVKMDQDGFVIASYLDGEGKLRFVYRIFKDAKKEVLVEESKGHLSKAGALFAMMKEVKKLKDEGAL